MKLYILRIFGVFFFTMAHQQEHVDFGMKYCTIPCVHKPDAAVFQQHDYIENITKLRTERDNKVSVIKIPDVIYSTEKLMSLLTDKLSVQAVAEQTFKKISGVNDAFWYEVEYDQLPDEEPLRFETYCHRVKNQNEKIFTPISDRQETDYNKFRITFNNFLHSQKKN